VTPVVVVLLRCENIMIVGFVTSSDGSKWRASYTSKWLNFREKKKKIPNFVTKGFCPPLLFFAFW
jgi:hypothetical protein